MYAAILGDNTQTNFKDSPLPSQDLSMAAKGKICDLCNGSGQISFFQGVSRFLLTVDECPHCAGTGLRMEPDSPTEQLNKKGKEKGCSSQEKK